MELVLAMILEMDLAWEVAASMIIIATTLTWFIRDECRLIQARAALGRTRAVVSFDTASVPSQAQGHRRYLEQLRANRQGGYFRALL